jgi:hypothetical protein
MLANSLKHLPLLSKTFDGFVSKEHLIPFSLYWTNPEMFLFEILAVFRKAS